MSDETHIQWTDHTFNPWWGCSRISPACRFCYADRDASRYGFELWRRHGERRMLSENNWRRPLKWNRDAEAKGVPARVFCASMADVFEDHPQLGEPRERLWGLIEATPWLHWQLLTKRPANVASMAPWGADWPANVWLGTSVETQRWADARIPVLLGIPARTRFLSAEPLLGPVDLDRYLWLTGASTAGPFYDSAGRYRFGGGAGGQTITNLPARDLHWVIVGGESGAGSKVRPMEIEWARSLVFQCRNADIATFVKQTGSAYAKANRYAHPKGGDPAEWPEDLRVRQFPHVPEAVPHAAAV